MAIPKYIIVGNFNYSGSGALIDYLREYSNLYYCDTEIRFVTDPYGIIDLENKLIDSWDWIASSGAITDFIESVKKGINSRSRFPLAKFGLGYRNISDRFEDVLQDFIVKISDYTFVHDCYYYKAKKNYFRYVLDRLKCGIRYYSHGKFSCICGHVYDNAYFAKPDREVFYQSVKEFFDELFVRQFRMGNTIILDQALSPNESNRINKYFSDAKMIIVDRDPRDIYADSCLIHKEEMFTNTDVSYIGKLFSKMQLAMRSRIYDNDLVLKIQFEDLVLEYEKTIRIINDFLGLSEESHCFPKKFFNPEISKNNIGLWKKFASDSEMGVIFEDISNYMAEYLYK